MDQSKYTTDRIMGRDVGYDSNLDSVLLKVGELCNRYGLKHKDFEITTYTEYGDDQWCIEYPRPKTQAEIDSDNHWKQVQEDAQRLQYEALKKKFEGTSKNV